MQGSDHALVTCSALACSSSSSASTSTESGDPGLAMQYAHNSYLTVIGVHEMHGRMHPNHCQITILLVVHLSSSLAYFMMTHPLPIAGTLPIKTLVARQLPTNIIIHVHSCVYEQCANSLHI